jgi:cytochrome b involved in lipid metabolism
MKTFIVILILVVVLGGSYFLWGKSDDQIINNTDNSSVQNSTSTTPAATSTGNSGGIAAMYTREEVATHNNSKDCWAIIGSSVYNLTSWISKHPGGEKAILSLCGKDGTAAFNNQHGGQARPEATLATFFIGTLKLQ